MKKTKLTIISLALMVFLTTSAFSVAKNNPFSSKKGSQPGVTYIVEVNNTNTYGFCHAYNVVITNAYGEQVVEPILLQAGVSTYVFHERTPECGMRIAQLIELDVLEVVCSQRVYAREDVISTSFRSGATYKFNLNPVFVPGDD